MKKQLVFWKTRIGLAPMLLALLIACSGMLGMLLSARTVRLPYADMQLAAAERMQEVLTYMAKYVRVNGMEFEETDLARTGLIGPSWTVLTTSVGYADIKRTALQPDWAALIVRFFHDAKLQAGDVVAVGASGSFPGLCLATICAANVMGVDVRIIPSLGASMHGATRPDLDIVKILEVAKRTGLLTYDLLAVSLGGDFDQGRGIPFHPEARTYLLDRAASSGFRVIDEPTLAESISARLRLFGDNVRCFVNIGGASANMGTTAEGVSFPNGLVINWREVPSSNERGLIFEYAEQGISVINLLNIRSLANRFGLLYDPLPLPPPGGTGVYFKTRHNKWIAGIALLLSILPVALALLHGKRGKAGKDPGTTAQQIYPVKD